MLVMRLFGCEINCELPLLAHSGPLGPSGASVSCQKRTLLILQCLNQWGQVKTEPVMVWVS
ncbi:hypothetical protein DLB95_04145 [Salmonella enterica subsp. diarizonae]|uniref:Uncharacterized protein n=2 Tax=Salmonella enterica TaxID=28901 RepID=A0A3V0PQS6_SALDZ|nr:hypothetical protein [Salmonella enterica subsp. diarizonae]EAA8949564.1 hypothetical protein [Salmonella enterica]EBP3802991.1 hypothetical protein [Salmonella enterica subsp. enterica]EBR3875136.1 hypothetical protein [Salmonella enterica subsp. arizonae]ECU8746326.1 hypothetical protein [Salmonella enterica subsp. diarizonae str. CFSAN000558]EDQ7379472.1 hypothetical protein [Salmonella enterica subsp. diarizonae serovar 35:l,v:z35]EDT4350783.1 hypothetical protein [Salmonella enterica 